MCNSFSSLLLVVLLITFSDSQTTKPMVPPTALEQAVDRIVAGERELLKTLEPYTPLAETYIQNVHPDVELGSVPVRDAYFLTQLDLRHGIKIHSFLRQPNLPWRTLKSFSNVTSPQFVALGFAQMIVPDDMAFDRRHYDFNFVRREFLGEVRTLVFDVAPRRGAGKGRFLGRIWVEDQDYKIVRFNGTYSGTLLFARYVHFDSWRVNTQPGVWLPAQVYIEESDLPYSFGRKLRLKGQTQIWGYGLKPASRQEEFTKVTVESPSGVQDRSESAADFSPVQRQRAWERQAEENVMERLQKASLLAPDGEVNKILETVANNLQITNNLDIQPEVRVRVLLTTQIESFTIGHSIVLSRGLVDTLPDEASLAMVLAHELAHIALGHRLDTKYAFSDRMWFSDPESFHKFELARNQPEEDAADEKAMEFLKKSPYSDKLTNAGLFLRALAAEAGQLPNLVRPHFGNRLTKGSALVRMQDLMQTAPALERTRTDQIAALPLGSRIKLDPWDNHLEMLKSQPVALLSAREKMPFEITPVVLKLTRKTVATQAQGSGNGDVPK
jgi:hypothetical protein